MNKLQKIGFIVPPVIFTLMGIIFLSAGFLAEDRTLKIMGAVWLPVGILNFVFIMFLLKKEK